MSNKKNGELEPWNYQSLNMNPNITYKIIRDNPGLPWNYSMLSHCTFDAERKAIHDRLRKKAARKILNWYLDIMQRPDLYKPKLRKFLGGFGITE